MNVMGMETIWTASVNQTCVTTLEKIFINMKDSFLPFHDHFYCAYV